MTHTKGPWAVSKQKPRRVTASGVVICNAVLRNQGGPKHKAYMKDEQEAEANARLIAAAPTLLDAVIAAEDYFATLPADDAAHSLYLQMNTAIAAARQESAS